MITIFNGNKLKNIRLDAGYTQKQIADILGCSQPSYQQYENGKRKPGADLLYEICKILKCSADELLGLDGNGNDVEY